MSNNHTTLAHFKNVFHNDKAVFGAIRSIKKNCLKIPNDIAVAGFSETHFVEIVDLPLTSIAQLTFGMGKIAGKVLSIIRAVKQSIPFDECCEFHGFLSPDFGS